MLVSDYVHLARELIKIAKDHGAKDDVINNKNDENTISDKIFDFSYKTIRQLRESGYNNTMDLSDVEFS